MPLQQFTAEWITPEDRIRVRIHAGDGQEYRFWLTRHFLAAFMGGARGLAVQVLAQQHPPEIAQAMDEFRQQSVGQQADFTRSFEPQAQLPLGEDALLLTGLTITQSGEHVSLTLGTATGLDITLSITETVLRGWLALLDRVQQAAGWQLDSTRQAETGVPAEVNADKTAGRSVLH